MKKYCENKRCRNESATEVTVSVNKPSDQMRSSCAMCQEVYGWGVQHGLAMRSPGLQILPPTKEEGSQQLYLVVYVIDVGGQDSLEATRQAHEMMSAPDSMRPVLHVLDFNGHNTILDLAKEPPAEDATERSDREARAFVATGASRCPKCHRENVDFAGLDIEGQSVFQEASCQDCDLRFYAVYRLVGFGLRGDGDTQVHAIAEDFGEIKEPS